MSAIKVMFGSFPTAPGATTTATDEQVALGRQLYHEQVLSKNGNLSCASCHDLDNFGQDGKPTSPGSDGRLGERNTPTVLNAFRQIAQFWDGRAATVEEQAVMPVLNPIEHGIADEAELVGKLKSKPELVAAFAAAFPGEGDAVSVANFQRAVGAFERTLATRSPFDDFLDGDVRALSNEQKQGLKTFMEVGCTQCHTTRLVGGAMFQKNNVFRPYVSSDFGRYEVTKLDADKNVFKVPSLLNVAKTAPYMHDGKVATLAEAVRMMGRNQLNVELNDDQVASIVAFLEALTGKVGG